MAAFFLNERRTHETTITMIDDDPKTREPQYQRTIDLRKMGLGKLGLMTNQAWEDDPKHLLFTLSRYKFVAKMLSGAKHVLEVGCADGFGTRLVVQEVAKLTAVDFDPVFVKDVNERMSERWHFQCEVHDMLAGPVKGTFDGIYALDVVEHIDKKLENQFLANLTDSLSEHGVLIIGTPSLESQIYASPPSKAGHVNCKDASTLKDFLRQSFHNVFIFSMNDEVVHTGYYPLAHYLFGIACSRRM
jgi:2-polyprenyl-3-methyl-5-hydroxy-6-metoxy-1,4-benzoquinol methylase